MANHLKEARKTTENLKHDSQGPNEDLNQIVPNKILKFGHTVIKYFFMASFCFILILIAK